MYSVPLKKKNEMIAEAVNLAAKIEDRDTSIFLLSGLLVFTDKVITVDTRKEIWRLIKMTQIGKMFWEEKEAAVKEAVQKAVQETEKRVTVQSEANLLLNMMRIHDWDLEHSMEISGIPLDRKSMYEPIIAELQAV